jgi:nitroreductase
MNDIINNMIERRSIRKYKAEQIMEAELEAILQAGIYAPSAGSRQSAIIVVCQNAEINTALGIINKAAFTGTISTETSYISKEQPSIADNAAIQSGFYHAPTVLTLFAPKNFLYSVMGDARGHGNKAAKELLRHHRRSASRRIHIRAGRKQGAVYHAEVHQGQQG